MASFAQLRETIAQALDGDVDHTEEWEALMPPWMFTPGLTLGFVPQNDQEEDKKS
jgi:hypothetical protein